MFDPSESNCSKSNLSGSSPTKTIMVANIDLGLAVSKAVLRARVGGSWYGAIHIYLCDFIYSMQAGGEERG